jgi:ABC-type sugar transport system permease subunit
MKQKKKLKNVNNDTSEFFLLISPIVLFLLIFIVYPAFSNFYYATTKWKGFGTPQFIGLANFKRMVGDITFAAALKNTFTLALYIPLVTLVPLVISAMLRDGLRGWKIYRALLYLPNIVGAVLTGLLFSIFLSDNGPVNIILSKIGINAVHWLTSPGMAIHTIGILTIWGSIGFGCIYFLAAMATIDPDLYDAAKIAGSGWWRTFFLVTIPAIQFAVEFWVVKSFINTFARMYGMVFTLTQGGPGISTITMEYGIYVKGFQAGQMGYASAWAVVLFFFCAVIALFQIRLLVRKER